MCVQHPQSQESFRELQIESLNFPWVQVRHVMYEGQPVCRDHLKEEVLLMLFNHMMENMAWNDQHILGNVMKDSNLSDLPEDNSAFEHHLSLRLAFHEEVGSFLLGHAKTQL